MNFKYQFAEQVQQFGTTIDSPPLFFITIVDLNSKQIKIGYQSYEVKIEEILRNYLQVTSCRGFITNSKPCFKVIQHGQYYGQLAIQQSKLASYGLQLDKPCFRVHDSSDLDVEELTTSSINRIYKINNNIDIIPVKINIQGVEENFDIFLGETLQILKLRLIDRFQSIKKQIPSNLYLMKDGFLIQDQKASMISYGITKNMKIRVVVKKKQGCLGKETMIGTKEGKRLISQLSVGNQIMSYNQKTMSLEVDQVTFIHISYLEQCLQISLDDGTTIQTTSNHTFLCSDNQYRRVDQQRDSRLRLKSGSSIRCSNNSIRTITTIKQLIFPKVQPFYHLCVRNNHNFVCNQLIVHNMFLNVILPDQIIEKVNIQPNQPFSLIKEHFQQYYQTQTHNQRLFYFNKELKNHQTMADKNIPKQSNIYLKFKPTDQFNYLHPLTPILTADGRQIPISSIKEGESVVTFDCFNQTKFKSGDLVVSIIKRQIKSKMVVKLDTYQQEIILSSDCYVQLQNGEAMNIMDLCYQYEHDKWPRLQKIDGSTYRIRQIAHQDIKPIVYYKLILSEAENYIANHLIVHNHIVSILIKKDNKKQRKITLGVRTTDKIITLKQRISQIIGISVQFINFSFAQTQLQNQKTLDYYQIRSEHVITANAVESISKSSLFISHAVHKRRKNEFVYLQLSQSQKIKLNYLNFKEKTVQQIMQQLIPNYQSSYFFLFVNIIILPFQTLNKIEQSQNQFSENVIIVVKNEKLAFIQNMNIKPTEIKSYSRILKKASQKQKQQQVLAGSRILVHREQRMEKQFEQATKRIMQDKSIEANDFKTEQFYMPFFYFTSKQYSTRIWKRIKHLQKYRNQVEDNISPYSIIKDLYINMNMLQNYYGKCYFGMKNFKCSRFFEQTNTFYWHSFIMAHKRDKEIISEIKAQNGTLFIIQSLNGKEISHYSLYPSMEQILFAPFTYFMIQKIEKKETYDVVYLSQISSPVTFKKNIVLWVDDEPKNNIQQIKKILSLHDIEILQVTSTILAEKWVQQFGWLLKWKGLNFKLISDMTRQEKGNTNKEAGVDLLQKLYKEHGITAKTLIYCGNRTNAEQKIKARKFPKERFFSIAVQSKEVEKFCQIEQIQESI